MTGPYRRGPGFATRTLAGVSTRAALRELECEEVRCAGTREDVDAIVARLLARQPPVTGLVVHNEAVLPILRDALRAAGRRVPEDVSVVAIAPDDIAEMTTPAVSAVDLPAEETGQRAVDRLMATLTGRSTTTLLAPRLVVRASSGSAPRTLARG